MHTTISRRFSAVFSKDEHGYFVFCTELPGCRTRGDTFEEARDAIREAMELYLETMTPEEIEAERSKEILTSTLEISVA